MSKILSALMVAGLAGSANAAVLFGTSFEAPAYAAGGQLWANAAWDSFGDVGFVITNNPAQSATGNQHIRVDSAAFSANGSRWNWVNTPRTAAQLASPNNIIAAEVKTAILSGGGTRTTAAGIDLYGNVGATFGRLGALRITDTGQFQILQDTAGVTTVWSSAANVLALNTYHTLRVEANFATQKARYFINGVEIFGGAGYDSFDDNSFSDADLYVVRSGLTGTTGGDVALFDDYLVDQIPSPSALALLGMGGLLAARRRR